MQNKELSLKGFFSQRNITVLLLICGVALFLNLRGIDFGLPSEDRLKISLGGREEVKKTLPAIRDALKRNIAERSEALEKKPENFVELAKLSPYFDQVRSNNPDEFFTFKNISYMVKNRTPCPSMFNYGPFYYYQIGGALFIAELLGFADTGHDTEYYLLNPEKMAPFYLAGRIFTAVLMTLAVAAVFLAGYRLGKLPAAVFCSLLFCFLPLVNLAGKAIKPEASLMFFSALTLFFSIPALKRALWRDYIPAGICIGLAAASKYPGVLNCSYLIMFHLIRRYSEWKKPECGKVLVRDDGKLFAAGAVSVIGFFIVNFAVVLNFSGFRSDLTGMAGGIRSGGILIDMVDSFLCYFEDGFRYTLGWPAVVAMSCAVLYNIFKPSKLWLGCLPGMLLFLYVASKGMKTSDAYFMPALIPLCLITGIWVFGIKQRTLRVSMAVLILAGTFSYCLAWNQVMAGRNVRLTAAEWINANVPAGSTICTLRYPVFYRAPMVSPTKYKLVSQFVQGNDIIRKSDYYVQTSYQWEPLDFWERFQYGEDKTPGPDFKRLKVFKVVPKAFFGLLPLERNHRLNHYFENIMPEIIIFKRDSAEPGS
ncbi:MAG: glycosyltransferase family 39 protein [Victivallaceae bacterium]|nr:glycosyltransferase family 39 protein [Victivallaceae bacterium]